MNGPQFAGEIISSLRQVGGEAAGGGEAIYPGDLINLGLTVFIKGAAAVNIVWAPASLLPGVLALLVLICCTLTAINMVLVIASGWVVIYAGTILLGFGGRKWTSDMAINYFRSAIAIGVSLLTMELIIGLGEQLLQSLVNSLGAVPDLGQFALVFIASFMLVLIAHQLPRMVAGIVTGAGAGGPGW